MPVDPTLKRSPAAKAANAARILGVVLVAFAVLGSMAAPPSARLGPAPHPPWLSAAVYGGPGVLLFVLSLSFDADRSSRRPSRWRSPLLPRC